MQESLKNCFQESSIHGFPYSIKRDLQWIERVLWLFIIIVASIYSGLICAEQWSRFQTNPLALFVDRKYQSLKIPIVGVTICGDDQDERKISEMIIQKYGLQPEDDNFTYYKNFFLNLSNVKYNTLHLLQSYVDDPTLNNIDFLNVTMEMKSTLISKIFDLNKDVIGRNLTNFYLPIMTERGLCLSNTKLHKYQDPNGKITKTIAGNIECFALNNCNLKVTPPYSDNQMVSMFFHPREEIVAVGDSTIFQIDVMANVITTDLDVEIINADAAVRILPPSFRKCLFRDEDYLEYFPMYTPGLCRYECRIKASLKTCKCKPFFYIAGEGPICNISGMICVSQISHLFDNNYCHCPKLCEELYYTEHRTSIASARDFVVNVMIQVHLPNVLIKKHVIFSMDELIVSFGGLVSLFLGCSILSIVEILFFSLEICHKMFKKS